MMMSIHRTAFIAVGLSLLAACGDASSQGSATTASSTPGAEAAATVEGSAEEILSKPLPTASAVGRVEGTDAYIAVVDGGEELTVYICDSALIALWFTASRVGTDFAGEHPSGATLTVRATATGFDGSVVIDGTTHTFAAATAVFPAGLWEGFDGISAGEALNVDKVGRFGWVVLADGTQRGAKVTLETTTAVGTLDPDTGTGDGGQVPATPTPPPPNTTGLTAEKCDELRSAWLNADNELIVETNKKRRKMIIGLMNFFRAEFARGECAGNFP